MSTEADFAYLAGLLDGEGHIGFYTYKATRNGHKYARLVIGITNSDLPVLKWVRETVGKGRIHQKRRDTKWRDCYTYVIQGHAARNLLQRLLPHLKIKHEKASFVLSQRTYGRVR